MREDDKIFHPLTVPWALNKYILHQVHDMLEHNGYNRTYLYLKQMYYWKEVWKNVNTHVKYCRQNNLCSQHYAQFYLEVLSMPMHFTLVDFTCKSKPHPKDIS